MSEHVMIDIIDYGAGNIRSVSNALQAIDFDYRLVNRIEELNRENICLIPGVGSFHQASKQLKERGFDKMRDMDKLIRPPILGICLGMQLLLNKGYEGGESQGLGLIKGEVIRISDCRTRKGEKLLRTKIGWSCFNLNEYCSNIPKFIKDFTCHDFYHVHSFRCSVEKSNCILTTYPGIESIIPTSIYSHKEKVLGFQFHPEKSGPAGLRLLRKSIEHLLEIRSI